MVTQRFATDLYSDDMATVRNSVDGWAHDVVGTRSGSGWSYQLNDPWYAAGFDFRFVLPDLGRWASGPNLTVPAGVPGELVYTVQQVTFLFVVELDPADYLAASRAYALRTESTGWDVDLQPTSRSGDLEQWSLDWGVYRSPLEGKFVIPPDGSDRHPWPTWMMDDNLTITAADQEYLTYRAQHQGPISFPFRIRLVGTRYAADSITLRDAGNGWCDRIGAYVDGAWQFDIPWTDYFDASEAGPGQVVFKFTRDDQWMTGPNLTVGPVGPWRGGSYSTVGGSYDFDDQTIEF